MTRAGAGIRGGAEPGGISVRWCLLPALLLSMLVLLPGCAGLKRLAGGVDPNDPCGPERQKLMYYQDNYLKTTFMGALSGAATGALGGALFGRGSGDVARGAVVGGVVGAAAGYFLAKSKEINDIEALSASIYRDLVNDDEQLTGTSAAFVALRNCRFQAAERVKEDYRAGRITRDEAGKRLDDLRRRFDEDLVIARELGVRVSKRGKEFQYASNELVKDDPKARKKIAQSQHPSQKGGGRKGGKSKRKTEAQSVVATKADKVGVGVMADTYVSKARSFNSEVSASSAEAETKFAI